MHVNYGLYYTCAFHYFLSNIFLIVFVSETFDYEST